MHGRGACMAGGTCVVRGCGRGVHGSWACMAEGVRGRGHAWQGTCVAGGLHGTHAPRQIPRDTVNARAESILLECILVLIYCSSLLFIYEITKDDYGSCNTIVISGC